MKVYNYFCKQIILYPMSIVPHVLCTFRHIIIAKIQFDQSKYYKIHHINNNISNIHTCTRMVIGRLHAAQ